MGKEDWRRRKGRRGEKRSKTDERKKGRKGRRRDKGGGEAAGETVTLVFRRLRQEDCQV